MPPGRLGIPKTSSVHRRNRARPRFRPRSAVRRPSHEDRADHTGAALAFFAVSPIL
jgi:hypothetical protein